MQAEYQLSLPLQTLEDADGAVKTVLEKAKAQVGFIPNMYTGMANSPGLLNTYLDGYTAFRQDSGFDSVEQEVVFLTISLVNGCTYCMAAHSFIADMKSKVPVEITNAIRDGNEISDAKLNALYAFTKTMVVERGLATRKDVEAFTGAGYTERHILEIILAISVKTISNYSNHLFHTTVDDVFAGRLWED